MNICKGSESLVGVQFDKDWKNRLLHFVVVLKNAVDCLWNIVHNDIKVDFVRLATVEFYYLTLSPYVKKACLSVITLG